MILGNYVIKFQFEDEVDLWRGEDGIVNIVIVGDVGENIMISDNGVYELYLFKWSWIVEVDSSCSLSLPLVTFNNIRVIDKENMTYPLA